MLHVADLTVTFDGHTVLDRFELTVEEGEIVAMLGPSGSGKSTVLRAIAGLLVPDSGRVHIADRDVTAVPTHLREIGMVFQDEQLFPHLTVGANIAFGLRMHGVDKAERRSRVRDVLELVGLGGYEDRTIDGLSGGEAKRVALARSLAPRPRVLLLDEPLTGLDRDLHDRLTGEVASILREVGTTAVWVTHDEAEASVVADRVVRLTDSQAST